MRILTLIFFNFLFTSLLLSQSIEEIKADHKKYFWGEGYGITLNRADQDALGMLINQISTNVKSDFSLLTKETIVNGKTNFDESFKSVINTYSNSTLKNTERIVISNEPKAVVFRYIERANVDKIFKERENKIVEFALMGNKSLKENEIAFALRYYYWSLTLLRSHPNGSTISIKDNQGKDNLLVSWLPHQINQIFENIAVGVDKTIEEDDLVQKTLKIYHKNKPVKNLDFSYWTGMDWSNIFSAKDGVGVVEFVKNKVLDQISIKVEYIFEGESAIDHELKDVMSKLEMIPFKNSYIKVDPNKKLILKEITQNNFSVDNIQLLTNNSTYQEKMRTIIKAIKTKDFQSVQHLFTTEGYQSFLSLLQYGKAKIIDETKLNYISFGNQVMCRSLLIQFSFQNNSRTFLEDVVFVFDENQKISTINFALSQQAYNDIANKDIWNEFTRLILINFLEQYKTAYALKNANYLEQIFDDEALIIVGNVLKIKPLADSPYKENQVIKYNKVTKTQYIQNLKHSFASNEFINIRFEDNIVRKSGKGGEVYGIQIKQNYFSSNYGDSGYLFLLIDLNDRDKPVIHVRTWQPQKNPDGTIFGLENF